MTELETEIDALTANLAAVRSRIGKTTASVDGVSEEVSGLLNVLDGAKDKVFTQAEQLGDSGQEELRNFVSRMTTLGLQADAGVSQLSDDIQNSFDALTETVQRFARVSVVGMEEINTVLVNGMTEIGTKTEDLGQEVEDAFVNNMQELAEKVSEILAETLGQAHLELMEEIQTLLEETIDSLADKAEQIGEEAHQDIEDLWKGLCEHAEKRFGDVLENQVETIMQQVIAETMRQVVEDTVITQLSAQITASLSAQLPQLTAAKYSVDAVKSLLDAL